MESQLQRNPGSYETDGVTAKPGILEMIVKHFIAFEIDMIWPRNFIFRFDKC